MSDEPRPGAVEEAAALFAEAQDLHAAKAYSEARPLYERSLRLREDPEVRAAYSSLMATLGPL